MWDAKYRRPGGRYPSKIDEATQTRWKVELLDTINSMSEGDLKTQALEAYNANRIRAEIFRWPQ
jgi:hypothetical protein